MIWSDEPMKFCDKHDFKYMAFLSMCPICRGENTKVPYISNPVKVSIPERVVSEPISGRPTVPRYSPAPVPKVPALAMRSREISRIPVADIRQNPVPQIIAPNPPTINVERNDTLPDEVEYSVKTIKRITITTETIETVRIIPRIK